MNNLHRPNNLQALLGIIRAPFLLLSVAIVLLGIALASWTASVHWWFALWALLASVLAHISVNSLNEYWDFKSGLDSKTIKTPFNGGSGVLPRRPQLAPWALATGIGSLFLASAIGLYLIIHSHWSLAILGLIGVATAGAYSPWSVKQLYLANITPGIGFGVVMLVGTAVASSSAWSWSTLAAAVPIFLLVNNLLLLNQIPDQEADRQSGRQNLVICFGEKTALSVFAAAHALSFIWIFIAAGMAWLPFSVELGLFGGLIAAVSVILAFVHVNDRDQFQYAQATNLLACLLTPVLMAAGLFLA